MKVLKPIDFSLFIVDDNDNSSTGFVLLNENTIRKEPTTDCDPKIIIVLSLKEKNIKVFNKLEDTKTIGNPIDTNVGVWGLVAQSDINK